MSEVYKRHQTQHTSVRIASRLKKDIERLKSEGVIPQRNSYGYLIQLGFDARLKEYTAGYATPYDVPHIIDTMSEKISDLADRLTAIESDLALNVDGIVVSLTRHQAIIDGLARMLCEVGPAVRVLVNKLASEKSSQIDELRKAQVKQFYAQVLNEVEPRQ